MEHQDGLSILPHWDQLHLSEVPSTTYHQRFLFSGQPHKTSGDLRQKRIHTELGVRVSGLIFCSPKSGCSRFAFPAATKA